MATEGLSRPYRCASQAGHAPNLRPYTAINGKGWSVVVQVSEQEAATNADAEQALIERWIEPDLMSPAEMRLAGSGIHLWAIIGATCGQDEYIQQVAQDYAIPIDAVRAAHAYYRRHPVQIDARVEANAAAHG